MQENQVQSLGWDDHLGKGMATHSNEKIRDTKGTFHAKMGTIKDRSGMELTEAEDIKKKWQEYTENYTKKSLWHI